MPGLLRGPGHVLHGGDAQGCRQDQPSTSSHLHRRLRQGFGVAKLYDRKTQLTAAERLNDRVIPFYDEHGVVLQRVLTDRGTEYCGTHDRHEDDLSRRREHRPSRTKTRARRPTASSSVPQDQLDEFYRIAFRKRIYATIDELQTDLDGWLTEYNEIRTHQGRYCFGKTPMQTFLDGAPTAREKQIGDQALATASA